jgi:hypothetical protein
MLTVLDSWLRLFDRPARQEFPAGPQHLEEHGPGTTGGLAPSTGCASLSDVGHKAFMSYTADYFFYQKEGSK